MACKNASFIGRESSNVYLSLMKVSPDRKQSAVGGGTTHGMGWDGVGGLPLFRCQCGVCCSEQQYPTRTKMIGFATL